MKDGNIKVAASHSYHLDARKMESACRVPPPCMSIEFNSALHVPFFEHSFYSFKEWNMTECMWIWDKMCLRATYRGEGINPRCEGEDNDAKCSSSYSGTKPQVPLLWTEQNKQTNKQINKNELKQ